MSTSIRLNLDHTNPGQFFACCGLLELADRLWPKNEVRGAFDQNHFILTTEDPPPSLKQLLDSFLWKLTFQNSPPQGKADSPLLLGSPFYVRLDWWTKFEGADRQRIDLGGGDQLKTWSGRQYGPLIFQLMKRACKDIDLQTPFKVARAVYDKKGAKEKNKTISPFYFDSRREATSLDIGFSPDEQNMSVMAYPAVEALALVGLQRFRPAVVENNHNRIFVYTAWQDLLPPIIAAGAVCGMINARNCGSFRFSKPSRGGEYATMFSRASRENTK